MRSTRIKTIALVGAIVSLLAGCEALKVEQIKSGEKVVATITSGDIAWKGITWTQIGLRPENTAATPAPLRDATIIVQCWPDSRRKGRLTCIEPAQSLIPTEKNPHRNTFMSYTEKKERVVHNVSIDVIDDDGLEGVRSGNRTGQKITIVFKEAIVFDK